MFNEKVVLITGGTGSFGRKFTKLLFDRYKPAKIIILSRDEFKQFEMAKIFPTEKFPIRYFLGDIRDRDRLYRAFKGVDYVVHAAALKQVPALEYNPFEAVKTNIIGAQNIVDAAIDRGVSKVIVLSTDKAVNPANLYGATKLSMEKIFQASGVYSGETKTRFVLVRYGNVVGSRGSVIPLFMDLIKQGAKELPITDERMTRFWITLEQGAELVLKAAEEGQDGEIFIPKIPSMKMPDLAAAMGPQCKIKNIGIRPGEKLHETLISEDEARTTVDLGDHYAVLPQSNFERHPLKDKPLVKEGFIYRSDLNDAWLSVEELKTMIEGLKVDE
jgi:UDP-N-acetylglucosamine 4,6-dehydratase (inverting)